MLVKRPTISRRLAKKPANPRTAAHRVTPTSRRWRGVGSVGPGIRNRRPSARPSRADMSRAGTVRGELTPDAAGGGPPGGLGRWAASVFVVTAFLFDKVGSDEVGGRLGGPGKRRGLITGGATARDRGPTL